MSRRAWFGTAAAVVLWAAPAVAATLSSVSIRGQLDVTGVVQSDGLVMNALDYGESAFDPFTFRVFADALPATGVRIATEFVASDQLGGMRNFGAYASWSPWAGHDAQLMAGKLPWFIGTWPRRSSSDRKALIGAPLVYQYHTTLEAEELPESVDALLGKAGTGQFGGSYDQENAERDGMPIVNESYWDIGAAFVGSLGTLEFAAGVDEGTPSAPVEGLENNSSKTILGRLGWTPSPAVRLGVSSSWGGYLSRSVASELPAGSTVNDYHQGLLMADIEVTHSRFELRAEGLANRWQNPVTGNLDAWGGYVEGKLAFDFGGYLAGRYDALRFSDLQGSDGVSRTWDANVTRYEVGAGYRFTRAIVGKLVFQRTGLDEERTGEEVPYTFDVVATQVTLSF